MFLRKVKTKNGTIQLAIMKSYRDAQGKVKQKLVEYVGTLDKLKQRYEDPVAFFTEKARRMTEQAAQETRKVSLDIDLDEELLGLAKAKQGIGKVCGRKNLGYAAVSAIYHELEINSFWDNRRRYVKTAANLETIFRTLVFLRLLAPGSKRNAFGLRHLLFEKTDFSLEDVYRALAFYNAHGRALSKKMHQRIRERYGRDTSLVYYDVTNYYFEIDQEDELRKKGVSKEHRPDPIVQMGLCMDTAGIPITYGLFAGNRLDKQTLIPMIHQVRTDYQLGKVIYVADKGILCGDNVRHIIAQGDGYVISYSIRGADAEFKQYVRADNGYTAGPGGFASKSRIYPRTVHVSTLKGGKEDLVVTEKQVVFYSPKYAAKARAERAAAVAKARDLIEHPGRYHQATSHGAALYVKNLAFVEKTGEVLESAKPLLVFDEELLAEEERYDGYYAIVTSELDCPDSQVIDIYRGLWRIEETFKITKTDLATRPVYLSRIDHIKAHFLICFVALVIARILEIKVLKGKYPSSRIIESLRRCSCSRFEENYYLFDYYDEVLNDLRKELGINFNRKYMTLGEIKGILGKTKQPEA